MTNQQPDVGAMNQVGYTRYVLRPKLPMRVFMIGAAAVLMGCCGIFFAIKLKWHLAVIVIFALIAIMGTIFFAMGVAFVRRTRTEVLFDDEGYEISESDHHRSGRWVEVTRVTKTPDERHITLYHGKVARTHLLCPSGISHEQFQQILVDLTERLSRAYQSDQPKR